MESEQPQVFKTLQEMGFELAIIQKAYDETKSNDESILINWIEHYQDEQDNKSNQENKQSSQQQQEGQSISNFVDQEKVKQIIEKGQTKIVAEKALFLTQDQNTVEAALEWINQHQNDPDFQEELKIVGQQEESKISEEEALQKAKELQRKMREERQKKDEQLEREREVNRIKGQKAMNQSKQQIEEIQYKIMIEKNKREKEQEIKDRQKILEQLERDKMERLGKQYQGKPVQKVVVQLSPQERFQNCIKSISVASPPNLFPDKAKICLQTIKIYIENIIKNPQEEKYRKIKKENNAFKTRVQECFGGVDSLKEAGFNEESEFFIMGNPNINFLQQGCQFIEQQLNLL